MPRDIEAIIAVVRGAFPDVVVSPIENSHPTDRVDLWYFELSGFDKFVQVESPETIGICPFLIENTLDDSRVIANSVDEVAVVVMALLRKITSAEARP